MVPRLYDAKATQFSSLGFGGMSEAQDCEVNWQLNGAYELQMRYPVMGRRFADLAPRQIITSTTGPEGTVQPFRIYRITPPLQGICTIYARHLAYDLMGHSCDPFTAEGLEAAVAQIQDGAVVQPHGFTIVAGFESTAVCSTPTPRAVWSMLGGQKGRRRPHYRL